MQSGAFESPKLIASLMRLVRDIGRAEEFAQDAFVSAQTQWPGSGIPREPGAWLMTAAKRRAIDHIRRERTLERKTQELGTEIETHASDVNVDVPLGEIDDDLLRLTLVACHPVLSKERRVSLTLRLLGGLSTGEIARAFLISRVGRRATHRARQTHAL